MSFLGRMALGALRAYSRVAPTQRGGYRLARLARRAVPRDQWRGTFATPAGVRLELDLATYPDCCMAVGLYELDTLRLLRRLLRLGGHFVDCGANVGYFTLAAAQWVGSTGRVDAFEPDPLNRARLEAHLAANGSPGQVRVHGVALSDEAGHATLYHPNETGRNHGEASLFAAAGAAVDAYTVETARLDEVLEVGGAGGGAPAADPGMNPGAWQAPDGSLARQPPVVIKMDIEGAELAALEGAGRLLASATPPVLVVEHNPASAAAAGHRPGDLLRLLRRHNPGYGASWVAWRLTGIGSAEEIDGMGREGNILYRV